MPNDIISISELLGPHQEQKIDIRGGKQNKKGMNQAAVHSTADLGAQIYDTLRARLEPVHHGKYVVIEVNSGDYEIDADHLTAADRAHTKYPRGRFYVARIGIPFRIRRVPGAAPRPAS